MGPVAFHDDVGRCAGDVGRHRMLSDGLMHVDVCMAHDIAEIERIGRTRLLVPEPAHAHLETEVTEAKRAALLELRGLTD